MVPSNRHIGHLADHGLGKVFTELAIPIHSMEDSNGYFCLGSTPTPRLGTMNKQVHPILRRIDELDPAAVNRRRFQTYWAAPARQATLSAIAGRRPPTNIEPVLIGAMSSLRFHR